jgi:hypothetical protein
MAARIAQAKAISSKMAKISAISGVAISAAGRIGEGGIETMKITMTAWRNQ